MLNKQDINRLNDKIDDIRTSEGLKYTQLSELIGIPYDTLHKYKSGKTKVSAELLVKICETFPQYTLWLMTGKTDKALGQISPGMKLVSDKLKTE